MIRTEFAADAEYFALPYVETFTAEGERANRIRCLSEDIAAARLEYVNRRSHIGKANKVKGIFGKMQKRTAFIMFNAARVALNRAEKRLAAELAA